MLSRIQRSSSRASFYIYPVEECSAVYYPVPKVGCTSWLRILCSVQGIDLDTRSGDLWFESIPSVTPREASRRCFRRWTHFSFVRNPWDRLVSCFLNKIQPDPDVEKPTFVDGVSSGFVRFGCFRAGMSFSDFVREVAAIPDSEADVHFRSQVDFLPRRRGGEIRLDFLGKFESFGEDSARLLDQLGLELSVPHDKKTVGRSAYREYYDGALKDLVATRYAADVRLLDYAF